MGWLFVFTVIFTNGHMIDMPFQSLETCREIRQTYMTRVGVAHVGECREIGK